MKRRGKKTTVYIGHLLPKSDPRPRIVRASQENRILLKHTVPRMASSRRTKFH